MSNNRAGCNDVNDAAVGNQPTTSAIRSVEPAELNRVTLPSTPTLAMTRFGIDSPGTKFRFDANGRGDPAGYTVTNPGAVGPVTVTFNTTAPTPPAGTPPRPATVRSTAAPPPRAPPPANVASTVDAPARVSNNRAGCNDVNDAAPPAGATPAGMALRVATDAEPAAGNIETTIAISNSHAPTTAEHAETSRRFPLAPRPARSSPSSPEFPMTRTPARSQSPCRPLQQSGQ